jgi:hypothetical protein
MVSFLFPSRSSERGALLLRPIVTRPVRPAVRMLPCNMPGEIARRKRRRARLRCSARRAGRPFAGANRVRS